MGKRLIAVLIIGGLGVAALPPLFGIAYEKQLNAQINAMPENPYVAWELVDYRRGLYSSRGALRLALTDDYIQMIRAAFENQDPADVDAALEFLNGELRFDVGVQHGPVTTQGGPRIGLATVHAELDSTTGKLAEFQQLVDVPYLLTADAVVDFDGSSVISTSVPAMSSADDESRFDFSGFDLSGRYDAGGGTVVADGGAESFSFARDATTLSMQDMTFTTDSRMLTQTLWLGKTRMGIADLRVDGDESTAAFALRELGVAADLDLNDAGDKLSMTLEYSLGEFNGIPDSDFADFRLRMQLRDIDRVAAQDYMRLYQQIGVATPEALEELTPRILELAARVLRGSPGIDIEPVGFTLNGEPFLANFAFDIDGARIPPNFDVATLQANPTVLLSALSAEGRLEASEEIAKLLAMGTVRGQIAASVTPQMQLTEDDIDAMTNAQIPIMLDGLVQQGMIRRNNNLLSTDFEYANGELTINGTPIPIGPQ